MQTYPPGTRIGQYEIVSRPMMGGMGVVYFALDHGNDDRPVAIKTFRPELLPDRAARDRFLREGTVWVELGSHPHIVRCYKVEYIDPTAFLVLELIAKEQNMSDASLRSWLIPGQPLLLEQALLFGLQIARGMQYATEKIPGFVHRDLKPENILVGADRLPGTNINRLRVTDFGLVKTIADNGVPATSSNTEELKPNQIQFTRGVGTPLYMAPEQWKGEPVGVFTDVYAYGCILHEMLTGQHITDGKTISDLQELHCEGRLRPLPENLPQDVKMILKKCLAIDPTQRYESWEEVTNITELSDVVEGRQLSKNILFNEELSRDEQVQIGWSYNAIGSAYLDIGDAKMAERYFERARIKGEKELEKSLELSGLHHRGLAVQELGDIRQALSYFEQSLAIKREISDYHGEGTVLGNIGRAFEALGDIRNAISYFRYAIDIRRKVGDRRAEGHALGNLGQAYAELGDFGQAVIYLEEALEVAHEFNDRRGEANILGNLGSAYKNLRDPQRAIMYHEQSLVIRREIGDRSGECGDLANIGIAYKTLKDFQRAISYYELALAIARDINQSRPEANVLSNLGVAYLEIGDTHSAISYIQDALIIYRAVGDKRGEALGNWNLGLAFEKIGDLPKAVRVLQLYLDFARSIGHPDVEKDAEKISNLQAQLQVGNRSNKKNSIQVAFEICQRATSQQDMQVAANQYPFMLDKLFIQAIEEIINEQIPPEHKSAFEQRLGWLRQIAAQK